MQAKLPDPHSRPEYPPASTPRFRRGVLLAAGVSLVLFWLPLWLVVFNR